MDEETYKEKLLSCGVSRGGLGASMAEERKLEARRAGTKGLCDYLVLITFLAKHVQ